MNSNLTPKDRHAESRDLVYFQILRLRKNVENCESKINQLQEQIESKERQLEQNVSPNHVQLAEKPFVTK